MPGLAPGFLLSGLTVAGLLVGPSPASAGQADAGALKPGYVGYARCNKEGCHTPQKDTYLAGVHGRQWNGRSPAAKDTCESCHGAGADHMASPKKTNTANPLRMAAAEASEICLTCHNGRSQQMLWSGSQHDQRNVKCVDCHSQHSPKGEHNLKAASELELCGQCHRAIVNKQNRLNHMPVREGKLECSSCHNPHGSANVKLLRVGTTANEACTGCHPEKRGPALWEHPPVVENCATCHDPHGTNNERMLIAKPPFLCQRCHVTSRHPPTPYEGFLLRTSGNANKIYGRECAVCHQMIHGSNAPSGKAFLR